jgi:hypothetical protein
VKTGRRWLVLGGLLSATLAAAAWIRDKPYQADAQIVAEVQTGPGHAAPAPPSRASSGPAQINIEKLRSRSLGESARDPFAIEMPPPKKRNRAPAAAPSAAAAPAPPPPAPPTAPPMPFTYMGKLLSGPEAKVFLTLGDRNLVLREGDTVDSIYRVEKIAEGAITLVYLPLNERQTIVTGESP